MGLFETYGGPWSARRTPNLRRPAGGFPRGNNPGRLVGLVAVAGQAIRCCCLLALLPIEAIFWLGFAVPIPWLFGIARAVLLAASWAPSVSGPRPVTGAPSRSPQSRS